VVGKVPHTEELPPGRSWVTLQGNERERFSRITLSKQRISR